MRFPIILCFFLLTSCDLGRQSVSGGDGSIAQDLSQPASTGDSGSGQAGCGEFSGCYTVYAHSDHVLYRIDLVGHQLVEVGPFNAPKVSGSEDSITDLAVAPSNTIYVISKASLYTASPQNGQVTLVGAVSACGSDVVGLTFMPDGNLYAADHSGAFCRIDLTTSPPSVITIGNLGGGLAVAGDMVAVADGTMYATVYKPADSTTATNNLLAKIDPSTGTAVQTIGTTGYPRLYGVAFDQGLVFGFTCDGSGDVVTIDPKTGVGTLYGTFTDPTTSMGIKFAGAGVNADVSPIIM